MPQKRYDDNFKYIEKRTFCNFFVADLLSGSIIISKGDRY